MKTKRLPTYGVAAIMVVGLCQAPGARAQPAQPPASATGSGPPDVIRSGPADGAAKPSSPTTTLPGVTVNGRRLKPCAPRDAACIDAISKEIWTRYPKQIETMCSAERIRLIQQGFVQESLGIDASQVNTRLTPATKTLCDYGKTLKAHTEPPKPAQTPAVGEPSDGG